MAQVIKLNKSMLRRATSQNKKFNIWVKAKIQISRLH